MTIVLPVQQSRAPGVLGASDAPAALGLSRYVSPLAVWKRLRGELIDEETPDAVKEAAEFGQLLEPIVRGRYALQRERAIVVPVASRVMDGWLRATSDGYVLKPSKIDVGTYEENPEDPTDQDDIDGLLQVKCRSAFQRDEWEGGTPAAEEVQCRVEMAVCGLPWNDCAVLLGGNRMLVHRIERDLALEDRILTDLRAFSHLVKEGREPSPDHTAAWRAHVSEKMRKTAVELQADEETAELVKYWLDQKRKASKADEEAKAALNDLLLRLSAAGATRIVLPDGTKIPAYKVGGRTDYKAYAAAHLPCTTADLAPYKREGTTWTLRAPGGDEE